jgi:hypothetical protein
VPAKFSAKNAADDELITIAYTFKTLTDDELAVLHSITSSASATNLSGLRARASRAFCGP